MNTIYKQNSLVKDLIALGALGLFFIGIPLGLSSVLVYFDLSYVVPAAIAIIAFVISVIFKARQKRLSTVSIVAFTAGLLFLASSLIEFGFGIFAQNMSIHDQIEFSGIMRPKQISHGLANIGAGIIFILVSFINIKSSSLLIGDDSAQNYKISKIIRLGAGTFLLLFGIYIFINGLRPLYRGCLQHKRAQQSVHLMLEILRQSQAVSHALSFFWLDGFAVPAPAQVTQTVRR